MTCLRRNHPLFEVVRMQLSSTIKMGLQSELICNQASLTV
jgi:hypothetical protein